VSFRSLGVEIRITLPILRGLMYLLVRLQADTRGFRSMSSVRNTIPRLFQALLLDSGPLAHIHGAFLTTLQREMFDATSCVKSPSFALGSESKLFQDDNSQLASWRKTFHMFDPDDWVPRGLTDITSDARCCDGHLQLALKPARTSHQSPWPGQTVSV
jgi:hypothetical protein